MSRIDLKTRRKTDLVEPRYTIAMDEVNARLRGGIPYWNWRIRWTMAKIGEFLSRFG